MCFFFLLSFFLIPNNHFEDKKDSYFALVYHQSDVLRSCASEASGTYATDKTRRFLSKYSSVSLSLMWVCRLEWSTI